MCKNTVGAEFVRFFDGLSGVLNYTNKIKTNYCELLSTRVAPTLVSLNNCREYNIAPSHVSEDHTPFEYSIKFSKNLQKSDIRVTFQPDHIVYGQQKATNNMLINLHNLNENALRNYDIHKHLNLCNWFNKNDKQLSKSLDFSSWVAFDLNKSGKSMAKTYYEIGNCWRSLNEALQCIEMRNYLSPIHFVQNKHFLELWGFSIDLVDITSDPRAKIYCKFDLKSLNELFENHSDVYVSQTANDVIKNVFDIVSDIGVSKKAQIAYLYNMNNMNGINVPHGFTLYIPMDSAFENDQITMHNIIQLLIKTNYNHSIKPLIEQVLRTLYPNRVLSKTNGLFQYLALNSDNECTLYFAPQLYSDNAASS